MRGQIVSAAIVIVSVVAYQIGMKMMPKDVSPISALMSFYVTALICTVIAMKFAPASMTDGWFANFSWTAVFVGVAIVGIELGYLLMYRSGWNLAAAPLVVMGGTAVLLTPIGLLAFGQPWSSRYLFGVVLCLFGFYLLTPQQP